jgi:hypothetical protein
MSNYPPGVSTADIDRHFGDADDDAPNERDRTEAYFEEYEEEREGAA